MNWIECPAVEIVPGRLSGTPVVKGSRVRPSDLLLNADRGAAWLADAHQLPFDAVVSVLEFHQRHKADSAAAV